MKISTKTGDKGETGLFHGKRVSKDSLIIDVLGELDELNSFLGWAKSELSTEVEDVSKIQDVIYRIMSIIGNEMKVPDGTQEVDEKDVGTLEEMIGNLEKEIEEKGKPLSKSGFVRPGANEISARFHICRTVCRRVERGLAKMARTSENLEASSEGHFEEILKYINRLSDLLFLFALKLID